MMWDWFSKIFTKKEPLQRKRVEFDIPFEQYSYRKGNFDIEVNAESKDNKTDC
ncbi:hypothetical protein HWQ46_25510 [Shewanella sp. D64]|uniref:hypothetical protein n=1 Tax=unclassified Shewanella TaxID=196818 RepID=UPI0022BA5503|nr:MULTISPECIES: hypothetical protein [unclassified Shewanella]MEC4728876.1 hypothetical protein [Shewanella sp. D64]MEC4740750.1 hypothetical protein [Shewanella sp. E94]WBJ97372.1 hypothetical protein HWQ47_09965 [Shewanella sp. MTB7]